MQQTPSMAAYLSLGLLALTLLGGGCDRNEIQSYQVAKTIPGSAPSTLPAGHPALSSMPPGHPSMTAMPAIECTMPAGWQPGRASSMRAASFSIPATAGPAADVAVIPLPAGGDELELVNMWRDQLHLQPASQVTAEQVAEPVTIGDTTGQLLEIESAEPLIEGKQRARIMVATSTRAATRWIFKVMGEASLVRDQKPVFLEFLKSVRFADAPANAVASQPAAAPGPAAGESAASPVWTVPAGWEKAAPGQFLFAKYTVAGAAGATAAVNVSMSAGDGGGLVGNVNRWRAQLGLPELSAAEVNQSITTLDLPAGGKASMVDMAGADARSGRPARVIAIVVPRADRTWFYKLMGDSAVVEAQKTAFTAFVQGVRY